MKRKDPPKTIAVILTTRQDEVFVLLSHKVRHQPYPTNFYSMVDQNASKNNNESEEIPFANASEVREAESSTDSQQNKQTTQAPPSSPEATSDDGAVFFLHPTQKMLETASSCGLTCGLLSSADNMRDKYTMPKNIQTGNVMGGTRIDASRADFVHGVTKIRACTIMGTVTLTVPAGVRVETRGCGILGSFSGPERDASTGAQMPAPLMVINGVSLLGTVNVEVNEDCPTVKIVE